MWESRILYLTAFAVLAIAAVSASASNNESAVFTNNQENHKIDANIPVVVVLKEQPLNKVSSKVKKEYRKRFKDITKSSKEIHSRIKPLTGSEEELRAKNISELVAIEQSLLTEKEKVLLVEAGKNLESNVTEMRREILAQTVSPLDEGRETIINKIRSKGGRVKYSSKVFNAIAADIPVSYAEELSKEEGVYKIYNDNVMNEDLDISTGAMAANKWWSSGYTGSNLDVAVIDSGIDSSHPALVQSVRYSGVFHDTAKTDPGYADNPISTDDLRGHGTHAAGIVAGTDSRYKGIAYGSKLINAKAGWLSKNGTAGMYESDAMKAIDWAIFGNPDDADVISLSFGNGSTSGDSQFELFMDAVAYELDTPVVKSAGNGGSGGGTITNPGGAFNIITVGNVDDRNTVSRTDDSLRYSSSKGPTPDGRIKPDISAPGTNIMSANSNWETEVDFVSKTGTSMAAPHIAGSIILLLNYKYYQTEAIKALLLNTAEDRGKAGHDNDYGFGYVDLSHAYIHRDDVFTGSVADMPDGSVEKFFKGNASKGDKATLVWNRHVNYINSSYPTTYFNISNLDLYMYDEIGGRSVSSSTSIINNVEQVRSNADYAPVVLKIEPYGIFPDGISLEDYALATEEGFTEVSQPVLNININNPDSVASGTNFNMDATVTNDGGVTAHKVDVTITLPPGFIIVSGANPQPLGTINAVSSKTAAWVVQAQGIAGSTPYSLEASAHSYSYGDLYSGSNISTIMLTDAGVPASKRL